jgi:hypothetical protein
MIYDKGPTSQFVASCCRLLDDATTRCSAKAGRLAFNFNVQLYIFAESLFLILPFIGI